MLPTYFDVSIETDATSISFLLFPTINGESTHQLNSGNPKIVIQGRSLIERHQTYPKGLQQVGPCCGKVSIVWGVRISRKTKIPSKVQYC